MRVLVTGGYGFIGSNLVRYLHGIGWNVDVVDDLSGGRLEALDGLPVTFLTQGNKERKGSEVISIIESFFSPLVLARIRTGHYDYVFHQAALPRVSFSVEHPGLTDSVNSHGFVKLLEACRGKVKRVIFASSSSVYGGADFLPTHESTSKNPKSPYALQKAVCEQYAQMFGDLYDLDVVCLRYFNVFGPGQTAGSPYATAVAAWCHAIKNDLPLRSDGDGSQTRDMCYVDNVVQANYLAAITEPYGGSFNGRCYNVACGDSTSNSEILRFLVDRFPKTKVTHAPWRPGDVMHTKADIGRISDELGYVPNVKFWDGLEKTLVWWKL